MTTQTTTLISVGDIADTDTRPAGWWYSADRQGRLDMTGASLAEAVRELLSQCSDEEQRAAILAGSLECLEPVETAAEAVEDVIEDAIEAIKDAALAYARAEEGPEGCAALRELLWACGEARKVGAHTREVEAAIRRGAELSDDGEGGYLAEPESLAEFVLAEEARPARERREAEEAEEARIRRAIGRSVVVVAGPRSVQVTIAADGSLDLSGDHRPEEAEDIARASGLVPAARAIRALARA